MFSCPRQGQMPAVIINKYKSLLLYSQYQMCWWLRNVEHCNVKPRPRAVKYLSRGHPLTSYNLKNPKQIIRNKIKIKLTGFSSLSQLSGDLNRQRAFLSLMFIGSRMLSISIRYYFNAICTGLFIQCWIYVRKCILVKTVTG